MCLAIDSPTGRDDLAEAVDAVTDRAVPAPMSKLMLTFAERQSSAVPHGGHVLGVTSTDALLTPGQEPASTQSMTQYSIRRRRTGGDDVVR